MSYCEAKIRWQDIRDRRQTGRLIVALPQGSNPFDFIHVNKPWANLPEIVGCERCPWYRKLPEFAEETIGPQIGQIHEQEGNSPPIVEIVCEGTLKSARPEKATCPKNFEQEQTRVVELYDRS